MKQLLLLSFLLLPSVFAGCSNLSEQFMPVEIPQSLPYTNERVNVHIADTFYGSLILEDKVITELNCDPLTDPSYLVYLSSEDVLTRSYSSLDDVIMVMDSDDVDIQPQSVMGKVKYGLSKAALKLVSWFW